MTRCCIEKTNSMRKKIFRTVLGENSKYTYNGVKVARYLGLNNFFYNLDGSDFDVDLKAIDILTEQVYSLNEKPLYTTYGIKSTVNKINNVFFVNFQQNTSKLHQKRL